MESLIPLLAIGVVILVISVVKIKDVKKKKQNPPRKWEGKTQSEKEQDLEDAERKTETQKGMGRAGGPSGGV